MVKSGDEGESDIYKVPGIGKHYTLKWTNLDNSWKGKKDGIKGQEKKRGLSACNKSAGNKKQKDSK